MSKKQKIILILGLGLIIVLFVVALGIRRSDDGDPRARNSFVDWLGSLGSGAGAVTAQEVTADCQSSSGRFRFTGTCVLHVRPDGEGMRMLTLRSSAAFRVRAEAPGDADFTMDDTVAPSTPPSGPPEAVARIAVDGQTNVEVRCPGPAECIVIVGAKE